MTNDQAPITKQSEPMPADRVYDLAERTACFGESIIRYSRSIRRDAVTMPLISQLVRSSTSIGANYLEADEAGSKREFSYRVSVCRREARETQYWLRMLVSASPDHADNARALWKEARELVLILAAIHRSATAKNK
jgi:four helix bundle protein